MAPLVCRVVDIFDTGVKGVCVFLDCCDRFYKCVVRLDVVTGEDGWICAWLPTTPPPDAKIEPQIMDTADFPGVSITFISPYQATLPWLSVCADLYLAGMACHGIVLCLEASPRLEYLTHSATGSTQRQPEINNLEGARGIAAENLTNRKRKLKTVDGDELRVSQQQLV
ncbi:hypothetical protein GGI35DRAFT_465384 [Trichoderma velutinum]